MGSGAGSRNWPLRWKRSHKLCVTESDEKSADAFSPTLRQATRLSKYHPGRRQLGSLSMLAMIHPREFYDGKNDAPGLAGIQTVKAKTVVSPTE
jgi:hypothetical protein